MQQEQIQELIDMAQTSITKMAEGMGVAVPELWRILIKQQYVEAMGSFIWFVVGMICFYAIYKLIKWAFKADLEELVVIVGFIVLGLFLMGVLGLSELYAGIAHIINPEYYAIKDIANFINPPSN